ncbi:MAG TPA: ABC transporter permease [Planctomycetaceae bacterium]|nr:ABC transporter permease [Planctomycetaceae bacterium]
MIPCLLVILFAGFLLMGLPVALCLCLAAVVGMLLLGIPLETFPQTLGMGMNSFPLLAVPFFILTGKIMNSGGITRRIFEMVNCVVGPFHGGLAQVNILSSLVFSGMSGAAVANAAGLGTVQVRAMKASGYDADFAVAVTAASATMGPIFPPSIILVVYGIAAEAPINRLFLGGILPALLMAASLMVLTHVLALKRNYPRSPAVPFSVFTRHLLVALPALFTPVIIIGGTLGGIFTATEAGVVAVLYAVIIGLFVYRELALTDLPKLCIETMATTAMILFIVGAAASLGWILTYYKIPTIISTCIAMITQDRLTLLLLFTLLYLFLGCFMEAAAIVVMTVPVVLPLLTTVGIDPIHFGIVLGMCMSIGTLTPPVGITMYVMCDIGKISTEQFTRIILPFLIVLVADVLIVAFFPRLVLLLPSLVP